MALTLVLPIYPDRLSPMIASFLGLAAVGGAYGLLHRQARQLLALLLPWGLALLLAFLVGGLRGAPPQQATEDLAPYGLFALGLWAGRGSSHPRALLIAALLVCVGDSAISIWKMPSFGPGMRSTYSYFKITAGLPLVGLFLLGILEATAPHRKRVRSFILAVLFLAAIVLSVSRGMLLGAALGIVVAAHIRKPSLMWVAAIGIVFVAIVYSSTIADLGEKYLRLDQAGTVEGRFREIRGALSYFASHPLFGSGLGSAIEVDGHPVAYVHNIIAYHLWKFGMVGSVLLLIPSVWLLRLISKTTPTARAIALGASAGIASYLVTSASYKTYYLVWMYGIVFGATLAWLRRCQLQRRPSNSPPTRTRHPIRRHRSTPPAAAA